MKRRNLALLAFGAVVTVFVFGLFIVQGWAFMFGNAGRPLTTLEPKGPFARSIQGLVNPVFFIGAIVFFVILGLVLYIGFRFRDRGDIETEDVMPGQLHGRTTLEIGWTILPALVLLIVGLLTVVTLGELNAPPGADALKVRVEGQQWWWQYRYDLDQDGEFDDIVTANEMVIPVGREISLTQSSNDVIHSFWIPALNGKMDVVPGMETHWKLQADSQGVYQGTCTEFCGLSHSNMRMVVRAVSADEFRVWSDNQLRAAREPQTALEQAGKSVFEQQLCSSCHLIRGVNDAKVAGDQGVTTQLVSGTAPDLTHFASRGTFAGSMFNSRYPNPSDREVPFGQTCRTGAGAAGTGRAGVAGGQVDQAQLPLCDEPDDPDAFEIPWTSGPGNPDNPPNSSALAAWLRDPPKMKPMVVEPSAHSGGRRRGMPNLNLSEEQIGQLVAYLNSLT